MKKTVRLLLLGLVLAALSLSLLPPTKVPVASRPVSYPALPAPGPVNPPAATPPDPTLSQTSRAALASAALTEPVPANSSIPLDRWPGATVLRSAQTRPLPDGLFRRVTVLRPSDLPYRIRIEDTLSADPATGAETLLHRTETVADHVLVHLAPSADPATLAALFDAHEATLGRAIGRRGLHRVQLAAPENLDTLPALLAALAASPSLRYAEPDYIVRLASTPNDARYLDGSLWGLHNTGQNSGTADADIDAPEGWAIRNSAPNVIVGVIDTGIKLAHQDLAPNLWINPAETADGADNDTNGFIDDLHGINAIRLDGNPDDDQGHGSHCAGTIGAAGNNGVGITGVAWNVKLMGLKFLSASGGGASSDAITCIDYGVENGAHILSNSWGGGGFSQALLDAIEAARDAGVLFVVAAGNAATDNDSSPVFPASLPVDNIVAVASTTRTDALSSFSCFGQGSVDIGAPGSEILSVDHDNLSGYKTLNGTSMATPHVAGALALLRAEFPSDSWGQLINRLYRGGDSLPALADGKIATGRRLNLHGALTTSTNRPLNDDFANARALFGDTILLRASNHGATAEPGQPAIHGTAAANTIWFTFTPATSGTTSVRIPAESYLFDPLTTDTLTLPHRVIPTVTEIFTGSDIDALASVASGTDAVTFTATAGVTYRIAVAGQSGAQGLVMLEVVGPPRNSTLATALPLNLGNSRSGTNRNALPEPGEPAHAGQPAAASIWYKWTANLTGRVVFTTRGSSFDTLAAVYSGPAASPTFATLVPVAANDDETGLTTSRVEFNSIAGLTYYFALDGKAGATGSTASVLAVPPTNDHFAEPVILSGTDITRSITTTYASREAGEPIPYANRGRGESLWFTWTAPESGRTTLDLSGSFFPGLIGVYTGNTVNALTLVTRDGAGDRFAQVTFDAIQGTTYRILVDAWDWSLNNVPLRLRMVPIPANDTFAAATELQGQRATIVGSNVGSTRETGEPSANSNGGGSVWFKWTAPTSGTYAIYGERRNKPDQWQIVLNVFTGTAVNALTHVKEDIGNGIGLDAFVFWTATAGQTYHIQVTGLTPASILGGVGPFALDLRPRAEHAAPNDNFANAVELDPATPVYNLRSHGYGTTAEPGEPAHSGYAAAETLWWKFTAAASARYVFSTALSEGSLGATVYRTTHPAAPAFANLVEVANNTATAAQLFNEVAFDATAGATYYIVTDRMAGVRGRVITHFQRVTDNYLFAGRAPIVGESANIVIQNHGAIRETGEPTLGASAGSLGHRSLWWTWTAPSSGIYQLDTIGSETPASEDGPAYPDRTIYGFDTRLAVYTGSALGALTQVAFNDSRTTESYGNSWIDFQRNSRLEFTATAGTTYTFLVNGENIDTQSNPNQTNTGLIRLNFARLQKPANDDFANATVITGHSHRASTATFGATKESGEPNHGGLTAGRTLWWRWAAPASGPYLVSTAGNLYDDFHARRTGVAVYTGAAVNALTLVTQNQNGAGPNTGDSTWSLAQFTAVEGTTYHFAVDAAFAGNLVFILDRPPANDDFANATVMQGSRWTAQGHNLGATYETNEPKIEAWFNPPSPTPNLRSVWWKWTAPVSGAITVDTLGSQNYNVLAVFTGGSVGALNPVSSFPYNAGNPFNGDATRRARDGCADATFNATAGTTYYICVQGAGFNIPSSGLITLSLSGPPATPFAPTDFTAIRTGPATIELDWTDVAVDEEYYEIERSLDGSGWTLLHQTPPDAAFHTDVTALGETTDYFYRIRAVNTVGASAWVTAAVTTPQPPPAPAGLAVQSVTTSSISLTWSSTVTATGYRLETSATGDLGPWTVLAADLAATTYVHTGLPAGSTRWYRLRAYNALGAGPWAPVISAATASTQTLVHDPFADADRTNGTDPLDVAWSVTGNTFAVVTDSTLDPASPHQVAELAIATTNKDEYLSFALPSAVSLGVGESLAVSFRLRHTGAPRADASATGVSLAHTGNNNPWANAVNRDYFFVTSYGANGTLGSIRRNAEGNGAQVLNSNANTVTLASGLASVDATTSTLAVAFEATRTGESAMRLRYRLGDGAWQEATDTGVSIITAFNRVFLRFRTRTDVATPAIRLDDVTVTRTFPVLPSEPQPPITAWRQTHFGTTANTGPAADTSDPDGDGLPNLLEYALALNPLAPGSAGFQPALQVSGLSSQHFLSFTFLRARAELTYEVLASSTLAPDSWTVIATNPGEVSLTTPVTVTDPVSENPRRFLRLRVTAP